MEESIQLLDFENVDQMVQVHGMDQQSSHHLRNSYPVHRLRRREFVWPGPIPEERCGGGLKHFREPLSGIPCQCCLLFVNRHLTAFPPSLASSSSISLAS